MSLVIKLGHCIICTSILYILIFNSETLKTKFGGIDSWSFIELTDTRWEYYSDTTKTQVKLIQLLRWGVELEMPEGIKETNMKFDIVNMDDYGGWCESMVWVCFFKKFEKFFLEEFEKPCVNFINILRTKHRFGSFF